MCNKVLGPGRPFSTQVQLRDNLKLHQKVETLDSKTYEGIKDGDITNICLLRLISELKENLSNFKEIVKYLKLLHRPLIEIQPKTLPYDQKILNFYKISFSEITKDSKLNINVWDRVLSEETIQKISNCEIDLQGNYIAWDAEWIVNNGTLLDMPLQTFCQEKISTSYFFWPKVPEPTALYLCEALGTHSPMARNQQEVDVLFNAQNATWPKSEMCIKYWSNLFDKRVENVWVRDYDNKIIEDIYWAPDEPNGNRYENCLFVKRGGMFDDDCSWPKCVVCPFDEPRRFSFRGTCEKELRHVYFVAYQESYGGLVFKGYGSYEIRQENGTWYYADTVEREILAVMVPNPINYPMGRRSWRVEKNICNLKRGEVKTLLLTPCRDDQYSCDDATCIPLHYRCDLKYDCRDLSDELNCNLIAFPDDYQKRLPPRVPRVENAIVEIILNVIIKSISIFTVDMSMQLSYELGMEWLDGRLEYLNLKANKSLNAPKVDTMMKLWSPIVRRLNTDTIDENLLSEDALASIQRLQTPVRRDDSVAAEVDVYSGQENPLTMIRKYSTVYTCNFDLTLYPFDLQYCDMHLQIVSGQVSFLGVSDNSSVTYLGSKVLNEYEIGNIHIIYGDGNATGVVKIRIPLIRLYGYAFLNLYTPSLVLLIISYLTLFFKESFFETRVMASLTSLLVLATLFAQASASLPKTSYFKVVDVWILFCVITTFLVIVFHILIDNQETSQTRVKSFNSSHEEETTSLKKYLSWALDFQIKNLERKAKLIILTLIITFIILYVVYILAMQ
ncbi:uncharacterized protein [Palaemon carinicauda]|uniref:uncharacterized protein n=1 Tax=Palaemon carinicauda TaxID=392227 RepID=UPI0035B5E084